MTEEREQYAVTERDPVLLPSWERMKEQAKILHKSGFFPKSIKSPEQAIAVMMAGRELGLGPMESLRSVYIVDGQTCISSGLLAAMIWEAGHGYEIVTSTDKECTIKFWRVLRTDMFKYERQFYTHTFTIEDAKKAGLVNKSNWQKYTKTMLFHRCLSAGGRAFLPDVTRRTYTPEEMGAPVTVTNAGDVVVDSPEVKDVTPESGPEPEQIEEPQPTQNGDPPRPWQPALVLHKLQKAIAQKREAGKTGEPSEKQVGLLAGMFEQVWAGETQAKTHRYDVSKWLVGRASANDMDLAEVDTLLKWLVAGKDPDTGEYTHTEYGPAEARLVLRQVLEDAGQQELM